jgi:hypothetical protein
MPYGFEEQNVNTSPARIAYNGREKYAQGDGERAGMISRARARNFLLLVLVILFAVLAAGIARAIKLPFAVLGVLGVLFGLLGVMLTVQTVRLRETRTRKILFMLTGVSATGIPVCVVLHNLVYALCIQLFGKEFWGPNGDEPVFFILGVLILPVLFLIGAVASGILLIRKRMPDDDAAAPSKGSG